jgi:hypothetical protein
MIPTRLAGILLTLALVMGARTAAAAEFRTSDYAYAATIRVDGHATLYAVPVNEDVYRHTVHADLSDVCVVNGLNEVVPFALRRTDPSRNASAEFSPLPLFQLQSVEGVPNEGLKLRLQAGAAYFDAEQSGANATRNTRAYLIEAWSNSAPVAMPVELQRPRQWLRATAAPGRKPGEYEFDLGMHAPIDQLNLELPEPNTVVDAAIYAQPGDAADWQPVSRARLYRMLAPEASELTNEPLSVPVTAARYWKVDVSNAGGGLGNGLPTLVAGVLPEDLLFVARGPGPFRLLYGNITATALAVPQSSLAVTTADASPGEAVLPQAASLDSPVVSGGDGRLVPVAPGIDMKRLLLWLVLVLGVAVLSAMTRKLSRKL